MSKFILSNVNNELSGVFDLFICCSSFEDRCYSLPQNISKDKYENSIVFYNADQKGKIVENAAKISTLLKNCELVDLHSDDPVFVISKLSVTINKYIEQSQQPLTVLIDISTFTHETLLMLFRLLIESDKRLKVNICYVDSKEYSFNVPNLSEKWLTKGVGDVRNIIGYPGYINPARKNHLIILFGFEVERTQRVIEKFEADIVSIGFGSEQNSVNNDHYLINQARHEQLLKNNVNINVFTTSLIDPFDTKENILQQIGKFPDTNIIIAPMNTKISTIGTALAFIENPDIQLCYVKANLYNTEGYSKPGENVFYFEIN